jgi:hypothetical protein
VKKWSQKSKQLRLTPMVEKVEPKIKTTSTDSNGGKGGAKNQNNFD